MIDIKEVAKTMTREEFIEEASKTYSDKLKQQMCCPHSYNLKQERGKDCCMWSLRCKECWENAVKDIKFKDDMEVEKVRAILMSKKLNIIEAMKMPIGTEFEVIHENSEKNGQTIIISDTHGEKFFKWSEDDSAIIRESNIFATFIPIQQPASFMEVVNSFRRCRVEHEFVEESFGLKFSSFISVMTALSNNLDSVGIKKVIKEGKWYIEESEAESNE